MLVFIQYSSTRNAIDLKSLSKNGELTNIRFTNTISYHDYLGILLHSKFALTDSSGIQDETTFLKIPCLTIRNASHKVETITIGTNQLIEANSISITKKVLELIENNFRTDGTYPKDWDLDTGQIVANQIKNL